MSNNSNYFSISTGTMIRAVLVVLCIYLLWVLRDLVLVILTSVVIASFIESAVIRMKKFKIGRVSSVVILYVVSISLLAGIFYLFAPLLITEVYNFSGFLSSYIPDNVFVTYFQNEAFSGAKDIVNNLAHSLSLTTLLTTSKAFIGNLSGGFFQTLSVAFGSIFNVILIFIISFYLSIQEKGIENLLRILVPIKYVDYTVDVWNRSRRKIALWMRGQMLLGLLVMVLTYLVLSIMGIQYALLLAIISGVMELIPYGIIIAIIPAIFFSYMTNGLASSLMVAGAYLIIHQFEAFLFSPLIIRKVVGLSPIVVILAALVGFELGGFWGLILAIPLAIIFMELLGDIEKNRLFPKIKENENDK
jgi:predicted PurR-regulated permease PerM